MKFSDKYKIIINSSNVKRKMNDHKDVEFNVYFL